MVHGLFLDLSWCRCLLNNYNFSATSMSQWWELSPLHSSDWEMVYGKTWGMWWSLDLSLSATFTSFDLIYVSFSFKLCNIPCSILLQKRKNIACHRDNISCGLPCNNELPCVQHKCTKVCHSVSLLILLNVTTEQATRTNHNNNCFCSSLGSLSGRGGDVSTAVPQEEGKLQSPVYDPLSRRQSVSVHPLQSRGQLSFYCRITSQRSELLSLSLYVYL